MEQTSITVGLRSSDELESGLIDDYLKNGDPVLYVLRSLEPVGIFQNRNLLSNSELESGAVTPYGVFIVNDNSAFVTQLPESVQEPAGTVCIRRWWDTIGKAAFPKAERLLLVCDGCDRERVYRNLPAFRDYCSEVGLDIAFLCPPDAITG